MRPEYITCAACGSEKKVGRSGPVPTYCSLACRAKLSYARSRTDGRYAQALEADRQRRADQHAAKAQPCPYCGEAMANARRKQCGKPDCKRSYDAERMRAWQRKYKATHGEWYPTAKHGDQQRAYGKRYRQEKGHWRARYPERAASADARRRSRVEQASTGERFAPREVHERDNWTCQLCGTPVDQTLKWPHPMSASLDHIVPLSHFGLHSLDNVQCAHLSCNCRKSDSLPAPTPEPAPPGMGHRTVSAPQSPIGT